jgi:hypothetical protein
VAMPSGVSFAKREPRPSPKKAGSRNPYFRMHGYVVGGSPEKHRGSPEVPVARDGRGIPFRAGARFQKGRRRLRVPLDWRKAHPRTPYPSAKPAIILIATSSIAISVRGR